MRSENEMFDLILSVARNDDRIQAVFMNGSRANPNAPKDIFQDYDIVYVVTATEPFLADEGWIHIFGETIVLQEPEKLGRMQGRDVDCTQCYGYLMQFTDGNRIDLHMETPGFALKSFGTESQTVVLLDKHGILPALPPASDRDYWVEKPTFARFYSRCNNFWWVAPYCAKGLWRGEILYAADAMNAYVREELLLMLSWYVCIGRGFSFSLGKSSKYLGNYLDSRMWKRLLETYDFSGYDRAWNAVFTACELFGEIAPEVGGAYGFEYDMAQAQSSFSFIQHIRELPKGAAEIY